MSNRYGVEVSALLTYEGDDKDVRYRSKRFQEWERINAVLDPLSTSNAAGTGFGMRDMQWENLTRNQAKKMRNAIQGRAKDANIELVCCNIYRM